MRTGTWIGLGAVTAVAVAAAVYVSTGEQGVPDRAALPETLFPGLMARVNDVATLTVQKGDTTWTIARGDGGTWAVAEKHSYPASADAVKKTVVGLADLEVIEAKTATPELYAKIDVADVDAEGSKAILLALADAGGAELAGLLIGKTRSFGSDSKPAEVFVRKPDEPQAWLVSGRLDVKDDILAWLEPETVKLTRDRVRRAVTTHADGEAVIVSRRDGPGDQFALENLPEGHKVSSPYRLGSIAGGLEFPTFEDVAPAASKDFADASMTALETRDGLRVTVEVATDGEDHWVRYAAEFDAALVEETPAPAEAAETTESPETGESPETEDGGGVKISEPVSIPRTPEEVRAEAEAINARVGAWAYKIPKYRADNFTRRMDDLTEPEAPAREPDKDS